MSRKDYREVAAALKAVGATGGDEGTLVALAIRLGDAFKADNPRFDLDRFSEAAGLDPDLVVVRAERESTLDGYVHSARGTAALHRLERERGRV